jgi:transposase-like protein
MRQRDARVAAMLKQHVPYRVIAARLGMSYGSLQQSVRRLRGEVEERERKVRVPHHKSRFDRSSDERW